jgi:hypothetical protein
MNATTRRRLARARRTAVLGPLPAAARVAGSLHTPGGFSGDTD